MIAKPHPPIIGFECVSNTYISIIGFLRELWERKPLLVQRHMALYNDGWFSTAELDKILREVLIL